MYLPKPIDDFLHSAEMKQVYEGMSAADVYRCQISRDGQKQYYYLKVEPWNSEVENEHKLYQWLYEKGKLPVPKPFFCIRENEKHSLQQYTFDKDKHEKAIDTGYLLLECAKGEILRNEKYYRNPQKLAELAAEGIQLLWQVDLTDCPTLGKLEWQLKLAEQNLRAGNFESLAPDIPYTKDFANHAQLFDFLVKNQPKEELVFTHGDYCLNNFFTDGKQITAFIDFGRGGAGDGYQDIALCIRELMEYCPEAIPLFYEKLGIKHPDQDKLRYYMLLDELF